LGEAEHRREVFDEDEEDMDFGARAILASRRLVVVPSARVVHHGPDAVLKKQLGIPFTERPHRGNEHF
jgi:GT2 family glycosyltransferase